MKELKENSDRLSKSDFLDERRIKYTLKLTSLEIISKSNQSLNIVSGHTDDCLLIYIISMYVFNYHRTRIHVFLVNYGVCPSRESWRKYIQREQTAPILVLNLLYSLA